MMATAARSTDANLWPDRRVMVFAGQADTHRDTGEDYETRTLSEIFALAPSGRAKGRGPAFIPSSYCNFDGRSHKAQQERGSFVALTGDIDKGDHQLERIEALVKRFTDGSAYDIYSTAHARPGNMRWRIILPLDEPALFAVWNDAQTAFFAFMEAEGVPMDLALARAGQPVYLPNVPPVHANSGEPLRDGEGSPLYFGRATSGVNVPGLRLDAGVVAEELGALRRRREADEFLRQQLRARAERLRSSRAARNGDGKSVIDQFVAENRVADLLQHYGYEQSPRNKDDWKSRYNVSGSYATRVIGDKWVSLSGSDAAAGLGASCQAGCYGDAYDLFLHYEHGGDHKAAWRQLCREQGRFGDAPAPGTAEPPHRHPDDPGWQGPPSGGDGGDGGDDSGEDASASLIDLDDVAEWEGIDVPPRRWLVDGWYPIGEGALLTGAGSVGKSLVSQQLAVTVAAGLPFMGLPVDQATSIYITCEDGQEEVQRRHKAIVAGIGARIAPGTCLVKSWKGELDLELAVFDSDRRMKPTKRFEALRQTALVTGARFIVLDNTSHLFGGDENTKREVAAFVNLLNGLAAEIDGVVLLLGHPNKTGLNNSGASVGDQFGGSVSWENQFRARSFMSAPDSDDPDARELSNPKANYSPKGNKLAFRWHCGAFVRPEDLPSDYAAELNATIRATGENAAFLRCLAAATEQRRAVSHNPGVNYAPTVFARMTEGKGYSEKAFKGAFERLLHLGEVKLDQPLWKRENRVWKYGIKLASECTDPPAPTPRTDPHHPSAETRGNACTDPHAPTPLYPTGKMGAATRAAAPDTEDLDRGDDGLEAEQ